MSIVRSSPTTYSASAFRPRAVLALGLLALVLPALFASAQENIPTIGSVSPPVTLDGEVSATIWVEGISSTSAIIQVFMNVTQPEGESRSTLTNIDLLGDSQGHFEVAYHGFFYPGVYSVEVRARNAAGNVSDPVTTQVTQLATATLPDRFDPDETPDEATWIGVNGTIHSHNFFLDGDEDWSFFYAEDFCPPNCPPAKPHLNEVNIAITNQGLEVRTKIELYQNGILIAENDSLDESARDACFRIAENDILVDESTLGACIEIRVNNFEEGFFFVRVTHTPLAPFGPDTRYDLRVWREQGGIIPGALFGIVRDADTGAGIPEARIVMSEFGGVQTRTNNQGVYTITPLIAGMTYYVEASADGYEESEGVDVSVGVGQFAEANFSLTPSQTSGEGEGEGDEPPPSCGSGPFGDATSSTGPLSPHGDWLLVVAALIALSRPRRKSKGL